MRPLKAMIKIENLVKTFGAKRAVDDVSFNVERGEVLGFLGPNGAGKSTTMRMITGFMPPTSGRVSVGGHDVAQAPLQAKRLIGYLPENAASYPDMTVQGFLNFAAELRGLEARRAGRRWAAWWSCASSSRCCTSRSTRPPRATSTAPASRRR
jgi:ABC-2 type transport system ATP-binding protein